MGKVLNPQQEVLSKNLKKFINNQSGFYGVLGSGGTGKTFTILHTINKLNLKAKEVVFLAPTNKVVGMLRGGIEDAELKRKVRTIASYLNFKIIRDHENNSSVYMRFPKIKPDLKLVVIDEVSMVSKDIYDMLINFKNHNVSVICIGDKYQIPPIESERSNEYIDESGYRVSRIFGEFTTKKNNFYELTIQQRQKEGSNVFNFVKSFRDFMTSDKINTFNWNKHFKNVLLNKVNNDDIKYFKDSNWDNIELKNLIRGKNIDNGGFRTVCAKNLTVQTLNWYVGASRINDKGYKVSEKNIGDDLVFDSFYRGFDSDDFTYNQDKDDIITFYTSEDVRVISKEITTEFYEFNYGSNGKKLSNKKHDKFIKIEYPCYHYEVYCYTRHNIFDIRVAVPEKTRLSVYNKINSARKFYKEEIEKENKKDRPNKKLINSYKEILSEENTRYSDFMLSFAKLKKPYAITTHKSQGSTYESVMIPFYDFDNRQTKDVAQLFYVAISRASKNIILLDKKVNFGNDGKRKRFTETERASIASSKNWICSDQKYYDYKKKLILPLHKKGYECNEELHDLRDIDIDHIKPLASGGKNSIDNLQAICKKCHKKKTAIEKYR